MNAMICRSGPTVGGTTRNMTESILTALRDVVGDALDVDLVTLRSTGPWWASMAVVPAEHVAALVAAGWTHCDPTLPADFAARYDAHLRYLRGDPRGVRLEMEPGASLAGANLAGANLAGASLVGASLVGASLAGANLAGANLAGANLAGANLAGANLDRASLDGETILETGETWRVYLTEVVPALLTAGGKALAEVVREGWECHSWTNCPMAVAFGVHRTSETPVLHRPRIKQFVRLYDARLIPRPTIDDTPSPTADEPVP